MMKDHSVVVEARNVSWLNLPKNLSTLQVRDETGRMYCSLFNPSDGLAQAALWEAVMQWNEENAGKLHIAPALRIQAWMETS